jgi:putative protein-disulfide isomerase
MSAQHLVYFADPMCSWCWGFASVMDAVGEVWGDSLPVRLVMGGLRPGVTDAMADAAKVELRGHWSHVTEASGQPFGPSGLDEPGFIYDTDPAARAVVLMRRNDPARALGFLHAVQRAFYAGGVNVTGIDALAALAGQFGQDAQAFAADLVSEDVKQETWRDYAVSRGAGVSGFPTLILGPGADGTYVAIARGFQPAAVVLPAIAGHLTMAA